MTNVIDLESYRQWLADLDEYASLLAEQYEAIYHEPDEEKPLATVAENHADYSRPVVVDRIEK